MGRSLTFLGLVATSVLTCSMGLAQGQEKPTKQTQKKEPIFASADKANFKQVTPGVSKAVLWGNDDKGPYGAFTKFAPGLNVGMYTHTNDVWLVGVKGAYLYKDEAGEKRVGLGSFIRIPGGKKHWSGGDAKEGALFYEESSGKFDLIPAK